MGLNLSGRVFSKQAIEQLKLILLSQNNTTTISTSTISISNNLPETTSSNISETTTTTTSTTTTTTTIGVTNREFLFNQAIECSFSQGRVKEVIDLVLNPSKLDLYLPISCNLTPSNVTLSNEGFLKAEKDTSLGDSIVLFGDIIYIFLIWVSKYQGMDIKQYLYKLKL